MQVKNHPAMWYPIKTMKTTNKFNNTQENVPVGYYNIKLAHLKRSWQYNIKFETESISRSLLQNMNVHNETIKEVINNGIGDIVKRKYV